MTDPGEAIRPLLRVRQVRDFVDAPIAHEALDAIADAETVLSERWPG